MSVEAAQRRTTFRVPVPDPHWISATIVGEDGSAAGAVLLDLSRMGMAARLNGDFELQRGLKLRCRLAFDDTTVDTEVTVRHCRHDERATRVGMEFTSLSDLHDSIISRAVFRLQRYLLRRQHGRAGLFN